MTVNGMIQRWVVSPFSVSKTYIYAGSNNGQRQVGYHNDGAKGSRFKFSEWCVISVLDRRACPKILLTQGMLSSWNKFCFTTGYVEVSVSLPGSPDVPGLWPGEYFIPLPQNNNQCS